MRYFIFLFCAFFLNISYAKVTDLQSDSFTNIRTIYQNTPHDPKTTLFVFDLDDTLITMTQPLGSVGWWDWQSGLLKSGSDPDKLFTTDFNELVRIQNILFLLIKMEVTDDAVIPFIQSVVNEGSTVLGLTARSQEHLSTTFMQLKDNKFSINDKSIFKEYGLRAANNQTSTAGNFYCPQFTREVVYQNGFMFLSGEDKGQALSCILANSPQNIKTIIFVDDSLKNSQSVDKAFANRNDINVVNILFTKENAKEDEIQSNTNMQTQISEDWKHIKNSLHDVIGHANL